MPGESEMNGQVPQLQIHNEDNETVLIQNGTPKKVEIEKSENQLSQPDENQQCDLKKVEIEETELQSSEPEENQKCELEKENSKDNSSVSVNEQEKEVEKVETETEQVEAEQCQLKQVNSEIEPNTQSPETVQTQEETENVQVEAEQCQLKQVSSEIEPITESPETVQTQVETVEEIEPACPLRPSSQIEEPKIETEIQLSETQQSETENVEQCETNKVEQDEDVPSCPITPSLRIEELKETVVTNGKQTQESAQNGSPKKVSMFTTLDSDAIKTAYEDVRSDNSETQWAVFKFQGSRIALSATGAEFEKFREQFTENERGFGYIRIQTGDEMSKRQKFLFITWVGPGVSVIQRAKMSTDKSLIKNIVSNFAVELQLENESDFDLKHFVMELNKAGGANYGTGIRDF